MEMSKHAVMISSSSLLNGGCEDGHSIPEDRVLSQAQLADSIRYGGCRDRSYTSTTTTMTPSSTQAVMVSEDKTTTGDERHHPPAMVARLREQQQHRKAAMDRLEEFFSLADPLKSPRKKSSPVSVLMVPQIQVPTTTTTTVAGHSPKRNIFAHIMEEDRPISLDRRSLPHQVGSDPDQHADSGYFLGVELEDDASFISTKDSSYHHFTRLKTSDRANSLPLECMKSPNSSTTMTKKASLKKISSIGQSMVRRTTTNTDGSFQRTVSFTSLSIREYPPMISDNPSCSFGPPVQLDWDYHAEETQLIDQYEESRQPRRANHELLLSYNDRRFLLLKQGGYSRKEVKAAMKEAERVKRERMVTDLFLPAQALDETMENLLDSVKTFFGKR